MTYALKVTMTEDMQAGTGRGSQSNSQGKSESHSDPRGPQGAHQAVPQEGMLFVSSGAEVTGCPYNTNKNVTFL